MPEHPPAHPVAVMVAMRTELRHFLDALELDAPVAGSGDPGESLPTDDPNRQFATLPRPNAPPLAETWPVWRGSTADRQVVAVLTGIGPANAAGALGALLAITRISAVISYGCAGAHVRELKPGDVVIGTLAVNHAAFNLLPDGSEHYRGNMATTGPDPMPPSETPSDDRLVAAARLAAAGWEAPAWPTDGRTPTVWTGAVASADAWTQEAARLDLLHERHGSLVEEMEAAALGVICQRRGIPLLAIKDVSNNEFDKASDVAGGLADFPFAEVGRRAAILTARTIARLDDVD